MSNLNALKVKIFADGAHLAVIEEMAKNPLIKGFTTNPTLMRKANVNDYRTFALEVLKIVPSHPVSFEVFSDDFDEMERQAHEIASWGRNVFVKIPVTNTAGEFAGPLIEKLTHAGVQLNVTAVMTPRQVEAVALHLDNATKSYVSVFAGRIADTGRDPIPLMAECLKILTPLPLTELIWASPRELLNIFHADSIGCHVITVTHDILAKLHMVGKDLDDFSVETVQMFYNDAVKAAFSIQTPQPITSGDPKTIK
jgi:transaldolase